MRTRTQLRKNTPTLSDVHINGPLTNISVAYVQNQRNFIALRAFPAVPVAQKSNLYYVFDRGDFLRDEARPRADATESAGGGFSLSTQPYSCEVEAFHKDVGDQARANADSMLQLDRAATEYVTQKLMIRRERRFISGFLTTGVWGTDVTGVAGAPSAGQFQQWQVATSDPVNDVDIGKAAVLAASGFEPNVLILGYRVFNALRNNPRIRDQFKYTSAESINEAMLANLFGVEEILVSRAVFAAGTEGAANQAVQLVAPNAALLMYRAPAPSLMTPSAGYTFTWNGYTGSVDGVAMGRIRMPQLKADRIEGEISHDFRQVASFLGYFFASAVA